MQLVKRREKLIHQQIQTVRDIRAHGLAALWTEYIENETHNKINGLAEQGSLLWWCIIH